MAKATTTQINYLRNRLNEMLDEKMHKWDDANPAPKELTNADILKMLKKGTLKLRKEPAERTGYCYSPYLTTYFEMPKNEQDSWRDKRDTVRNAYRASITTIMDSFVLSGSDFTMALQAFEDLNIE